MEVPLIPTRRPPIRSRRGGCTPLPEMVISKARMPARAASGHNRHSSRRGWPEERATNQRRIVVTGRTQPGAIVVLGDERVEVQPDGRFTHVIALREGRQRLSARAHGGGGSASSEGPVVVLDTRAPDPRFDTSGLWARPRKN